MLKTAEEEINENNGERFKVINIQKYKNIIKEYDKEIDKSNLSVNLNIIALVITSSFVALRFLCQDYIVNEPVANICTLVEIGYGIYVLKLLIESICCKTNLKGNVDRLYDELELNGIDINKLDKEIETEEKEARGKK